LKQNQTNKEFIANIEVKNEERIQNQLLSKTDQKGLPKEVKDMLDSGMR